MRRSRKPVRKCHACLLNLGDSCWLYKYPRGQWRGRNTCPGRDSPDLHESFGQWQKSPNVKTRKDLRREFFRTRRRTEIHHVAGSDKH